jgi:anaerobic glycerol-3-phosphate dehydrogenase
MTRAEAAAARSTPVGYLRCHCRRRSHIAMALLNKVNKPSRRVMVMDADGYVGFMSNSPWLVRTG